MGRGADAGLRRDSTWRHEIVHMAPVIVGDGDAGEVRADLRPRVLQGVSDEAEEQLFRRMMGQAFAQALREADALVLETAARRQRAAEGEDMEVAGEAYRKLCFDFPLVGKDELSALATVLKKHLTCNKKMPFPLTFRFASGVSYLVTSTRAETPNQGRLGQANTEGAHALPSGNNSSNPKEDADEVRRIAQTVFMCVFVKVPAMCFSAWKRGDQTLLSQALSHYHLPNDRHFEGSFEGGAGTQETATVYENQCVEEGGDGRLQRQELCDQIASEEDDDSFEFESMEDASSLDTAPRDGEAFVPGPSSTTASQRSDTDQQSAMRKAEIASKLVDLSGFVRYDAVDCAGLWEELGLMDDILEILTSLQALAAAIEVKRAPSSIQDRGKGKNDKSEGLEGHLAKVVGEDEGAEHAKLVSMMRIYATIFCDRLVAYPSSSDWHSGHVIKRFLTAMGVVERSESGNGIASSQGSYRGSNVEKESRDASKEGQMLALAIISTLAVGLLGESARTRMSQATSSSPSSVPAGQESAAGDRNMSKSSANWRRDKEKRVACLQMMWPSVMQMIPFLASRLSELTGQKDLTSEWLSEVNALMQIFDLFIRWAPAHADIAQSLLQTGIIRDGVQLFVRVGDGPPMEALRQFMILAAARSGVIGKYLAAIPSFRASTESPAFMERGSPASMHGCIWPLILNFMSASAPSKSMSSRSVSSSSQSRNLGGRAGKGGCASATGEERENVCASERMAVDVVTSVVAASRLKMGGDGRDGVIELAMALGFLHRMLVLLQDVSSMLPLAAVSMPQSPGNKTCIWKVGGPLDAAFAECHRALSEVAITMTAAAAAAAESLAQNNAVVTGEPLLQPLTPTQTTSRSDDGASLKKKTDTQEADDDGNEDVKWKGKDSCAEMEHKESAEEKTRELMPYVLRLLKEIRAVGRGESVTVAARKSD